MQNAGFMLDVIGSSNVTNQSVSTQVPQYNLNNEFTGLNTTTRQFTTNIIDLSMGFKFTPVKYMSAYFNFLVPLNSDGLRTDFVPSAGVQMQL
jgi:hypothetical protein